MNRRGPRDLARPRVQIAITFVVINCAKWIIRRCVDSERFVVSSIFFLSFFLLFFDSPRRENVFAKGKGEEIVTRNGPTYRK